MNQPNNSLQPQTPSNPQAPAVEIKPENAKKIKIVIITVIILAIVVLGTIFTIKMLNEKQKQERISKDKQIIQLMYDIRKQTTDHYTTNKSYKDWWPQSQDLVRVSSLGSTLILRKPDFQNYIMYAYLQSDQKFFCIDTYSFADVVANMTDDQIKCQ